MDLLPTNAQQRKGAIKVEDGMLDFTGRDPRHVHSANHSPTEGGTLRQRCCHRLISSG